LILNSQGKEDVVEDEDDEEDDKEEEGARPSTKAPAKGRSKKVRSDDIE
jgi:hypothetical protein